MCEFPCLFLWAKQANSECSISKRLKPKFIVTNINHVKQNVDIRSLMHTQFRDLRDSELHGETNRSKEKMVLHYLLTAVE